MNWNWQRIDENNWRLGHDLAVTRNWVSNRWHVVRGGKWEQGDYLDAGAAIAAAEKQK